MKKIVLVLIMALVALTQGADITSVSIFPSDPTDTDDIDIEVYGTCHWDIVYDGSYTLSFDPTDSIFDITLDFVTDYYVNPEVPEYYTWNATINLGSISSGSYLAGVITISPDGADNFTEPFTVTPEPCSLLLFSATALLVIRRKRK